MLQGGSQSVSRARVTIRWTSRAIRSKADMKRRSCLFTSSVVTTVTATPGDARRSRLRGANNCCQADRVTTTIALPILAFQRDQDPSSPADAELCARHRRAHNIALIQMPGFSIPRANADPSNQVSLLNRGSAPVDAGRLWEITVSPACNAVMFSNPRRHRSASTSPKVAFLGKWTVTGWRRSTKNSAGYMRGSGVIDPSGNRQPRIVGVAVPTHGVFDR